MTFDSNVSAAVSSGAAPVQAAVLNIPLHASTSPTFPERVRSYASSAEAVADTLLGTEGKAAVAAHFGQDKYVQPIKIGRLGDSAVAQVDTITVGGTPAEDDVYTITVNGVVTEYVAGATPTVSSVHTALDAAVTAAIADEDVTVGGADPDITLTADNAGEPFSVSVSVDGDGTLTLVHTTPNAGIGSDLDAILAEDAAWKWFTCEIDSTPADNLVNMKACSSWGQINKRNFIGQSSDADVLTATAGNDLEELQAKSNSRTAYVWHHDNSELVAVKAMAYKLQADPDEKATGWHYTPMSDVTQKDPKLTSTQQGNINDEETGTNFGNLITTFRGSLVFGPGVSTTNKHLDTIIAEDWLEARQEEEFAQTLLDFSANNLSVGLNDKELRVFVKDAETVLARGVRIGHLNEGTTEVSIVARADMPAADVTNRLIRVTSSAQARGAAEKVSVTTYLELT